MAYHLTLTESELGQVEREIVKLQGQYDSVESVAFLTDCRDAATRLPERLKATLRRFRTMELGAASIVVHGFEIDDAAIGPSPANWNAPWSGTPYLREEIYQCLLMSAVGEIFSYRTLEQGRFLRHVTPDHEKANDQVAGSSNVTLEWHTEEAFHPARGDFQSLMCYRNHERAETQLAEVDDLELPEWVWRTLRQARFYIRPDQAHHPGEYDGDSDSEVFRNVIDLIENPHPRPLVTGPQHCPFLVVDQAFMEPVEDDVEAREALHALLEALNAANQEIVLDPGDVLLFDNQRAPHGRSAFTPLWGPNKRWLRVLYGTADLRKSIAYRSHPESRVVG